MARDTLYLTVGPKDGRLLAVITRGCVQRGDQDVDVLSLDLFDTQAQAQGWFKKMKSERPWETRQ